MSVFPSFIRPYNVLLVSPTEKAESSIARAGGEPNAKLSSEPNVNKDNLFVEQSGLPKTTT
jgi:hypothetical protein